MKKQNIVKNDTLLSYELSSDPSPLEVSSSTNVMGDLIFEVASNKTVRCKVITIAVPVGIGHVELYFDSPQPTGRTKPATWSVSSDVKNGKTMGYFDINYTVFTLNNGNGDFNVQDSFRLTISGAVNTALGVASIELAENSALNSNSVYSIKKKTFFVSKATPPAFYVRSFTASLKSSPTIPASEFSNSEAMLLSWESNGKSYEIYQGGNPAPIATTAETTVELTKGISIDTTFVLKAIDGNKSILDALTLSVSNPTSTPQTINVADSATVKGITTLVGNTTVNGELKVDKQAILGDVSVNSCLNVTAAKTDVVGLGASGDLSVDGTTTLSGLTTHNQNNLNGTTSILNATITESINAKGAKVAVLNGITTLATGITFAQTMHTAKTDGFLFARIGYPTDISKMCNMFLQIYNGQWFPILGGSTGTFGSGWSSAMVQNNNSLCIPVPAGATFGYMGGPIPNNQLNATMDVYWMPMGTAPVDNDTFEVLTKHSIKAPKIPIAPINGFAEEQKARKNIANKLNNVLEKMLDKKINTSDKEELVKLFMKL